MFLLSSSFYTLGGSSWGQSPTAAASSSRCHSDGSENHSWGRGGGKDQSSTCCIIINVAAGTDINLFLEPL